MVTAHGLRLLLGCILCAALLDAAPAWAQRGAGAGGEWPTYGGDLGNTKYSPLDQIDRDNFGDLEIAWRWRSADGFLSKSNAAGGELWADSRFIFAELDREDPGRWRDREPPYLANFKATPLMVGGRLYVNLPTSAGAAIDARSGETLWVYNPQDVRGGHHHDDRALEPARRGVLDGRQRRADSVGHEQRLSGCRRRTDRASGRGLWETAGAST